MNKIKKNGLMATEALIMFPVILSLIKILVHLITFNILSFSLLYINAQGSRYASLSSTQSKHEIINYVKQQAEKTVIPLKDLNINIETTDSVSTPGGLITLNLSIPNNFKIYDIFPDKITSSFLVIKEG